MKSKIPYLVLTLVAAVAAVAATMAGATVTVLGSYKQVNLVANTPGALHNDARMINPWGNAFLSGNPFWINDEGSGVSELIDGQGNIFPGLPFVSVPKPPGALGGSRPTGIVANGTASFALKTGGPAFFIFATLDGVIAGWNTGTNAVIVVNNSKTAQYTGLAMATISGKPFLYAANSIGGIDVFNGSFKPFKTLGGFVDPKPVPGMKPYNIANIDGFLFVTYEKLGEASGLVNKFKSDGTFIERFATGGTLNKPWGIALASNNFGPAGNHLLIGNFGDGKISVFQSPTNNELLGLLGNTKGTALQIPGLWSLVVGDSAAGVTNPNNVYFTAGPDNQLDGLFGYIALSTTKVTPTATHTPTSTRKATPTATATYVPY